MSRSVPREWLKFRYLDAKRILVGLRNVEQTLPLHQLRPEAAALRTHELRKFGQGRQAALFCYGIGQVLGVPVSFAQVEAQDYDIVARYIANDEAHYVPVQLKEWVPETIQNARTLQAEIDKLSKYVDSTDLVVAFHLNRDGRVRINELVLPVGKIAELWFFGAMEP